MLVSVLGGALREEEAVVQMWANPANSPLPTAVWMWAVSRRPAVACLHLCGAPFQGEGFRPVLQWSAA